MTIPTPTIVDDIPGKVRTSQIETLAKWVLAQPLDKEVEVDGEKVPTTSTFRYDNVSQNIAGQLKAKWGLDAATRDVAKGKCTLYVRHVPSLVAQIKADTAARSAKAKAARKSTNGSK